MAERFATGEMTFEELLKAGPAAFVGFGSAVFPDGTAVLLDDIDELFSMLAELGAVQSVETLGDRVDSNGGHNAPIVIPDNFMSLSLAQIMRFKVWAEGSGWAAQAPPFTGQDDYNSLSLLELMKLSIRALVDEGRDGYEPDFNLLNLSLGDLLRLKVSPSVDTDRASGRDQDVTSLSLAQLMTLSVVANANETEQDGDDFTSLNLAELMSVTLSESNDQIVCRTGQCARVKYRRAYP